MGKTLNKLSLFLGLNIIFNPLVFTQVINNYSMVGSFPINLIKYEFDSFVNKESNLFTGIRPFLIKETPTFNISFNHSFANNVGHSNIDNNGEFYALNGYSNITSMRFNYNKKWFSLFIEPYIIQQSTNSIILPETENVYKHLNNLYSPNINDRSQSGIRQSGILFHYRGIGIGYSNISNWWGPGVHSSIALSSNAPGVETYSVGTFKDLRYNNFSFGIKAIVSPYNNYMDVPMYFSGLDFHITYYSKPTITLGILRTYLSADFDYLSNYTSLTRNWTIKDAFGLIFEPLFGQDKSNLDYTTPGTPGFDLWDEILTGYINFTFPDDFLKVYIEVASDDNRANLIDLKAHWDHTLGYLIGFRKYFLFGKQKIFISGEYLNTIKSNTEKFYRSYPRGYYGKSHYDFFTYSGRRMGAHSGSSSDDLIFMVGLENNKNLSIISVNKERHGVKSTRHPELKTELNLIHYRKIGKHHSVFLSMEYEYINNFGLLQNKTSESKLFWVGYSFSLN